MNIIFKKSYSLNREFLVLISSLFKDDVHIAF